MKEFFENKKFIKIHSNTKMPKHKLNETFSYDEIQNETDVGILLDDNWVVLDIDNERESDILFNYVTTLNIKCYVMKTDRGKHFWFKSKNPVTNKIRCTNALGVSCDVKSFGKKSYVVVKKNNEWRKWETRLFESYEEHEIQNIPDQLLPIEDKKINDLPNLCFLKEGEGRNEYLFKRIIPLYKYGKKHRLSFGYSDKLRALFLEINAFVFEDSLKESEINAMFNNNEIFEKLNGSMSSSNEWFDNKGKLMVADYALHLKQKLYGLTLNGVFYYYDFKNNIFTWDDKPLKDEIYNSIWGVTAHHVNEILKYILHIAEESYEPIIDPYILNVRNGLLDLKNKILLPHSPKYFTVTQINTDYNPDVKCQELDYFLQSVTQSNSDLQFVIEEMIGDILRSNVVLQKCYILYGEGSNGKSLLCSIIQNMLGEGNYSNLDLHTINRHGFGLNVLSKVKLNVSSETPNKRLVHCENFKKLVSGDSIEVDVKFKEGIRFKCNAKFVFATNHIFHTNDASEGFYRRFKWIPFNAYFSPSKRDPELEQKLSTEDAKSALLNRGICGLERLIKNNDFSPCEASDKLDLEFKFSSNSILRFIGENLIHRKTGFFNNKKLTEFHKEYTTWCLNNNLHDFGVEDFKRTLIKTLEGLKIADMWIQGILIKEMLQDTIFEGENNKCLVT